jgi:HEAT repeat protein
VRRASADALGRLGHRPAVPALRTLLREEAEDADVRGAAAVALGRLHADEAVDDLTWALGDEEVASDALTALLQLGRGLPELLGKLDTKGKGSRGQKSSRLRTLRALGTLGDPGAVGALLIATADRAAEVRTTAVHALSELVRKVDHGARPADWPRLREDIGAGIEKLFKDPAPSVRVAALNAGVVRPTLATLAWLAKDPDEEVRYQAVGSMKHFGVEAIDLVTASLKDTDETVRAMAVDARAAMGDPAMVDALIAAAGDPAPRVRIQAAYALAPENKPWPAPRMPAIRETLLRILGDTDMTVRHAGAAAFGRLRDRDPAAVDALIAALRDPEPYVREQVVRSLADIGAKRALPAVLELESDPYPVIRDVVAMAAGNLKRYGR